MANEFQDQFQEALREAEFADLKKHADDISSSVAELSTIDPIADAQKDVERAFEERPAAAVVSSAESPVPAALPEPHTARAINVPAPEAPVAVTHEDVAAVEPPPAKKAESGT
jgi:sec-independent protein translocase protein TatB